MRYAMVKAKERSEQAKCKLHGSQSQHSCSDSPAVCRFNVTLIPSPFSGIEASSVRSMCSGSSVRDAACTE